MSRRDDVSPLALGSLILALGATFVLAPWWVAMRACLVAAGLLFAVAGLGCWLEARDRRRHGRGH